MISRKLYYLITSLRKVNEDRESLRSFQEKMAEDVINYTGKYSSFYPRKWQNSEFEADEFTTLEDLDSAPVIEKNSVKENKDKIKTLAGRNTAYESTGTLGDSFRIPFEEQAADWREAITARTEIMKGYRPRNKIVELFGKPQTSVGKWFRPKTSVSHDASLQKQIEILESEDPDYLIYGAHILFRVCKRLKYKEDHDIEVKGVFSIGELLTPNMRRTIEQVLNTEVYSIYETSEVGQIAYECPEGGYHINEDLVYLEILDDLGEPVETGEKGHAVVTGLVNRAIPLIRYKIGDTLVKGDKSCSCRTNFKKIERIEGRTDNIVTNSEEQEIMPRKIIDTLAKFEEIEKFVFEKKKQDPVIKYQTTSQLEESKIEDIRQSMAELGFHNIRIQKSDSIERLGWKAAPIRTHN